MVKIMNNVKLAPPTAIYTHGSGFSLELVNKKNFVATLH
jgi:hypothetical protein